MTHFAKKKKNLKNLFYDLVIYMSDRGTFGDM